MTTGNNSSIRLLTPPEETARADALDRAGRQIISDFRKASDDYTKALDRVIDATVDYQQRLRAARASVRVIRMDSAFIAAAAAVESADQASGT